MRKRRINSVEFLKINMRNYEFVGYNTEIEWQIGMSFIEIGA